MVRRCYADEPKNTEIGAYGSPWAGYVVASISMLMANSWGRPLPLTFIGNVHYFFMFYAFLCKSSWSLSVHFAMFAKEFTVVLCMATLLGTEKTTKVSTENRYFMRKK